MTKTVLGANVAALRRHLGLNQSEFAELVGGQQPHVSKWETKGMVPSTRPLSEMARLAGVPVADFMDKPWTPALPATAHPDQLPTRSVDAGESVEIVQLDLSLAMGAGTLIDDFVESEKVSFDAASLRRITRTDPSRLRFVTGIGTSHEPKFLSGDQFLIDINDRTLSRLDGYYWITWEGAHALKRLRPAGGGKILIISENPDFAPIEVERDAVRIEGRAVWFARGL